MEVMLIMEACKPPLASGCRGETIFASTAAAADSADNAATATAAEPAATDSLACHNNGPIANLESLAAAAFRAGAIRG